MKREFWIPMDVQPKFVVDSVPEYPGTHGRILIGERTIHWAYPKKLPLDEWIKAFEPFSVDYFDAPHKPGDVVRLLEEWFKVSVYYRSPHDIVAVIRYRDGVEREIGIGITTSTELASVTDWQPASTMPAWAMRSYTVQSIAPAHRDLWAWRCVGELGSLRGE